MTDENTNVVNLGRVRRERRERIARTVEPSSLADAALSIMTDNRAARIAAVMMSKTMKPRRCYRQTAKAFDQLTVAATPIAYRDVTPIRPGLDPLDAERAREWLATVCRACRRCPLGAGHGPAT